MFSFKQVVVGNGWVAGVRMDGRALLEMEKCDGQDEFWITGVAPVGIAGGGTDRAAAFTEFRKAWMEVVFDVAAASTDFASFDQECRKFLSACEPHITKLWDDAVLEVRRKQYVDPALNKGDARKAVRFDVVDISSRMKADRNEIDNGLQVAA